MIASLATAAGLFLAGVYLSALFSGAETAFYRVSTLRLSFHAAAGKRRAARVLTFAGDPARFVATLLVGNNVANYLTTAAVGIAVGAVTGRGGGAAEVVATWLISPVVFVCGELTPKRLCYLAPSHFLGKSSSFLRAVFLVAAPVAVPLAGLAKLLERDGESGARRVGGVLGRGRLIEVLDEGHRAGLLIDVQDRLTEHVLHSAPGRARDRATPAGAGRHAPRRVSPGRSAEEGDRPGRAGGPADAGRPAVRRRFAPPHDPRGVRRGTCGSRTSPRASGRRRLGSAPSRRCRPGPRGWKPSPDCGTGANRSACWSPAPTTPAGGRVVGVLYERGLLRELFGRV